MCNFNTMRPIGTHNYFVYILTNKRKTVLYVGVTNDLEARLYQHGENEFTKPNSFTGKYKVKYLVYWERYTYVNDAIDREKQIKRWNRTKKVSLIESSNPDWRFMNDEIREF